MHTDVCLYVNVHRTAGIYRRTSRGFWRSGDSGSQAPLECGEVERKLALESGRLWNQTFSKYSAPYILRFLVPAMDTHIVSLFLSLTFAVSSSI